MGPGQNLHPVHLFHFKIGNHQVKAPGCQQIERLDAAIDGNHLIPLFCQDMHKILACDILVLHNKYIFTRIFHWFIRFFDSRDDFPPWLSNDHQEATKSLPNPFLFQLLGRYEERPP
jgi:hypothetical protein